MKAKTGSLAHVYSLAGYATTQSGDHIVFSVITNNSNMSAKKALDSIDHIVVRLLDDRR